MSHPRSVAQDASQPAAHEEVSLGWDSMAAANQMKLDVRGTLPEPFREAVVLRDLNDLSYRDIAEAIGTPVGTVMSRLSRARDRLIELMDGVGAAQPSKPYLRRVK